MKEVVDHRQRTHPLADQLEPRHTRILAVSVAVPVQRFRAVRGALMLSTQGADIDNMVTAERLAILKVFLIAAAVMVATHDTEFAASLADRIVLLGQGVVIADGPPEEVLGGGRHFSTEVARVTNGAALLPEEGAAILNESPSFNAVVDEAGVRQ